MPMFKSYQQFEDAIEEEIDRRQLHSIVPGDSRREVEKLLVDAEDIIQRSILNDAKAVRRVIKALRILNENRSPMER